MGAWVAQHRAELDPARTLVVSLDTLGSGEPAVVTRESPLLAVYRREDLDWADRGALRAGVARPRRSSMAATTDGIMAHHAGLRTVSLVSVDDHSTLGPHYHQASDTPGTLDYAFLAGVTRLLVHAVLSGLEARSP